MLSKNYAVYIMSNKKRTVLYIGVTSDLEKRIYQHKNKLIKGFSSKYNCTDLVYFEITQDVYSAIGREKELKGWKRVKKDNLILQNNPPIKDLSLGLT